MKNSIKKYHFSLVFIIIACIMGLESCKSDKPEDTIQPKANLETKHGIYIINEGNFQFGNASVSYYNPDDQTVVEDIYKQVNQQPLGDVCQSMQLINGWYYLVVNNSQKIEIVNPDDFKKVASITGFSSPRYILPVSSTKAYVSDFKSHRVSILNLSNRTKTGEIAIHGWTEEMYMMYGKVYITNMKTDKVYVVDAATDVLEDSIVLAQAPGSMVEDLNGKLWILCQGDNSINKAGALCCYNPAQKIIEKRWDFSSTDAPMRLCTNDTHDTLYFINKHIYQMPVNATGLPGKALIDGTNTNFYGMAIAPKSGQIFVADAIDYIQKGKVYHYNAKGQHLGAFKVGLIPSRIYFK